MTELVDRTAVELAGMIRRRELSAREPAEGGLLLASALREFSAGRYNIKAQVRDIERYNRRAQAGAFAQILRGLRQG